MESREFIEWIIILVGAVLMFRWGWKIIIKNEIAYIPGQKFILEVVKSLGFIKFAKRADEYYRSEKNLSRSGYLGLFIGGLYIIYSLIKISQLIMNTFDVK